MLGINAYYLVNSLAPTDPTLSFVRAVGVDFVTSCNSVPPGQPWIPVTMQNSGQAWREARALQNAKQWTGNLTRFATDRSRLQEPEW
jgi:hypothetical protein